MARALLPTVGRAGPSPLAFRDNEDPLATRFNASLGAVEEHSLVVSFLDERRKKFVARLGIDDEERRCTIVFSDALPSIAGAEVFMADRQKLFTDGEDVLKLDLDLLGAQIAPACVLWPAPFVAWD